jgi:hypothetical protein
MGSDGVAEVTGTADKVFVFGDLTEELEMMYGMGWGMGSMSWLILILTALGIAALIKYLMSGRK